MDKQKRKEMVMQAMQEKATPCIYLITNLISNKRYIGSTMNYEKVMNKHLAMLKFHSHYSTSMQEDWDNYGEQSFKIENIGKVPENRDADFSLLTKLQNEAILEFQKKGIYPEKLLQ